MRHPAHTDLALYATGDLPLWQRVRAAVHLHGCDVCREAVDAFRTDRGRMRVEAGELPDGLDWDRLSAEMTANIHVGLAAGECVSPLAGREPKAARSWFEGSLWSWQPAAIVLGVMLLMVSAWWLNMPPGDTQALQRVAETLWERGPFGAPLEEPGPLVEASSEGIVFRENGSVMGVGFMDIQPVVSTVSLQGSASAQYIDDDTGQVTITAVYVQ